MTVEVLQLISLVTYIIAALLLVIAIVLFFVFNIPAVFGSVTGRTARREIENIRSRNEQTGGKTHKSSAVNKSRSKLTEKIATSRLTSNETTLLGQENEPVLGSNETTVLNANETTVLNESNETTVLTGQSPITDVLEVGMAPGTDEIITEVEIIYVQCTEIIR